MIHNAVVARKMRPRNKKIFPGVVGLFSMVAVL
jgi:hypothetical protein